MAQTRRRRRKRKRKTKKRRRKKTITNCFPLISRTKKLRRRKRLLRTNLPPSANLILKYTTPIAMSFT